MTNSNDTLAFLSEANNLSKKLGDELPTSNVQIINPWTMETNIDSIDPDKQKSILEKESIVQPQSLLELSFILKDILAGDPQAMTRPEFKCLNLPQIKAAIEWITGQGDTDVSKALLTESWRLNFRDKPPTPEEFLTQKYIGHQADSLHPWIRDTFIDFFDPTKPYRNLVLSSCIGTGKDQPLYAKVYTDKENYKLMGDIQVGDDILSPDGSSTKVIGIIDWKEDDIYELEMDNGKTMQCGPHHINHVSYRKDEQGNRVWEDVETTFLLDNPDLVFTFENVFQSTTELKKITFINKMPTRCITVANPNGLYITDNGIVTHNSTITMLINVYLATLFALMYAPYKYYGYAVSTQFTLVFAAISQKKASELLVEPLINILRDSNFFMQCRTKDDMIKETKNFEASSGNVACVPWTRATPTSVLEFANSLSLKLACNEMDIIGQNIVCGNMTELAFWRDAGKSDEQIMKFFGKLRDRIDSRMKGNYISRFILDSSPNTLEGAVDKWIWEEAPKDKSCYVFTGPRWKFFKNDSPAECFNANGEIKHDWNYCFPFYKGANGKPPRIIESEMDLEQYDPIDIIWCPRYNQVSMEDKAKTTPNEFLRDWCGVPAGMAERIFSDNTIVDRCFNNKLMNANYSLIVPAIENPEHLIWNQIKGKFFHKIFDRYYFYYEPHASRVLSVDQSISGDCTGISISHTEYDKSLMDEEHGGFKTVYITDLVIVINPAGGAINLDAIKYFILDLMRLGNMKILKVGFDNFQSVSTRQFLQRNNVAVEYLSVDKDNSPYLSFIDYAMHGRWHCGDHKFVKNNMKSLKMTKRKTTGTVKIDHNLGEIYPNSESEMWGLNAKDATDCIASNIQLLNAFDNIFIPTKAWNDELINGNNYEDQKKKLDNLLASMGLTIN